MRVATDRDQVLLDAGVQLSYVDANGTTHTLPDHTRDTLAATLAAPLSTPAAAPILVRHNEPHPGLHGVLVTSELNATTLTGTVPSTVPHGWHHLVGPHGPRPVAVVPDRLPEAPAGWGWSVQLYAARRDTSWGIGDFADLAWLAQSAAADGATALLVSPVHAVHPRHPADSPYAPASREWLNVLHIAVPDVPGADRVDLSDLQTLGHAHNDLHLIDRARVWATKRAALERIWAAVRDDLPAGFEEFVVAGGDSLRRFCTWSVLADTHDGWWATWPEEFRRPESAAVARFAAEHDDQLRFWAWCQWVADTQLGVACGQGVDVVLDLAVGFDAGGADGWVYQDLLALDFEVGCPPDKRNLEGQRWGLPPFKPGAFAAAGYAPWVAMVRAALRHAAGLRMDHVMQLWRLFWIPAGGTAADGGYVTYPADDLLKLLCLEAGRTGTWVVGEDMGTIVAGSREQMADVGMLGYRVATRVVPEEFPANVMASAETHDQPLVAGIANGTDATVCRLIGKAFDETKLAALRADLMGRGGVDPARDRVSVAELADVVAGVYRDVTASRAQLVLATLEDAALTDRRPNIPSVADYPCWRLPLRPHLDAVYAGPLARRLVAEFTRVRGTRR